MIIFFLILLHAALEKDRGVVTPASKKLASIMEAF